MSVSAAFATAPNPPASSPSAVLSHLDQTTVDLFGFVLNVPAIALIVLLFGIMFFAYRIQHTQKLDFADMITKDGRAVSLTKVLQAIGGMTATWIMIKLTLQGQLTESLFGLYLMYVAGVEGYSKYVSAKYGYTETSVKDAAASTPTIPDSDLPKPPKD